jgi:hypothetical protein
MAAGLQSKEPQYGDIGAMREMGVKYSPETSTPTFFKPQGGRPPTQAGQVPAPGGAMPAGSPPAPGIPPEHEDLMTRAKELADASRSWQVAARQPGATEKVKRIAAAVKEAARIAVMQTRSETPFIRNY